MIGILGSGFGIYGYLPALINLGYEKIYLLNRSITNFNKRPELQYCKEAIVWEEDEKIFLSKINVLIIALPPLLQSKYIDKIIEHHNLKNVLLEKPIAPTPLKTLEILQKLRKSKKKIRTAYTFKYANWASIIVQLYNGNKLKDIEEINIIWDFKAHHYKNNLNNWKRYHSQGGGALRFYGIHIIAFLIHLSYNTVENSKSHGISLDDYAQWSASFSGENLPKAKVFLNSNSQNEEFTIKIISKTTDKNLISLPDPFFNDDTIATLDKRIKILEHLLISFDKENDKSCTLAYEKIALLWGETEKLNFHQMETLNTPDI